MMKRLIYIPAICLSALVLNACVQAQQPHTKTHGLTALARFVANRGGDKVHISQFVIIKDFANTVAIGETVNVGYYAYKGNNENTDTVLLTLDKYDGQTKDKHYFICPDYDVNKGIQKAKVDFIGFDYWEGCETGRGDCKPLTFTRTTDGKNWYLIMPCGGTETDVTVSSADGSFSAKQHLLSDKCPPYLVLTDLKDGKYVAGMMACGLGGSVQFNLMTLPSVAANK